LERKLTSLEAAKRNEFGPQDVPRAPANIYNCAERARREFRNARHGARRDIAKAVDPVYRAAKAREIKVEFRGTDG